MELYKFVKSHPLLQGHTINYHTSELNEISTNIEIFGGATLTAKSIFSFGIRGSHQRSHKKLDAVDISHVIEGDSVPRMIYFVYKLGQAAASKVEEERAVVDRLFFNKKRQHHYKSVDQQFMFFACIEQEDNKKWPDVFLVAELNLDLNQLGQSLSEWKCLFHVTAVKNSNAFIKLKSSRATSNQKDMIIYAYLNSIRKTVCKNCHHVWSLVDFLDLLICKQVFNSSGEVTVSGVGYELQKKFNECNLWTFYLPPNAFITDDSAEEEDNILKRMLGLR